VTEHGSERVFREGAASAFLTASAHDDTYDQRVVSESTTAISLGMG
jgi:hypothetical protein